MAQWTRATQNLPTRIDKQQSPSLYIRVVTDTTLIYSLLTSCLRWKSESGRTSINDHTSSHLNIFDNVDCDKQTSICMSTRPRFETNTYVNMTRLTTIRELGAGNDRSAMGRRGNTCESTRDSGIGACEVSPRPSLSTREQSRTKSEGSQEPGRMDSRDLYGATPPASKRSFRRSRAS